MPAFESLRGPHDLLGGLYRSYTRRRLRQRLEEAGFTVERLTYFNTWLFPAVAAVRGLRRVLALAEGPPRSDLTMPE